VLIDLIGFGIVLPLLPLYAERFGASVSTVGLLTASYALAQFIFAPIWGRLSDRVGRRPVILLALVGTVAASLTMGLADALWLLFLARVVDGISGASYAAAQAYIADVTTPEERAHGMGMIGAAFGLGFILGPALGALFALIDPRAPFFAAAALAAGNLLLAYRRLPEPERHVSGSPAPRRSLLRRGRGAGRRAFVWLTLLGNLGFVAMETTFALFAERRFDFGLEAVGLVFAYIGIVSAIVQGGLVRRVTRRYGEPRVMVAGLALTGVALALLPACYHLWELLPVLLLLAGASGLALPTITAGFSRRARADEQGGMLGILASAGGLARIVAPPIGTALLQHVGLAAPYLMGAALFAVCTGLAAAAVLGRPEGAAPAAGGVP
jgi:MFS transporter, DHA1 family, tetracycline resistance protein